jgi:hypothetical protein
VTQAGLTLHDAPTFKIRLRLHHSLLLGAAPLLLLLPPACAVPTCLLLDSTLRDTCDTMARGTS